MGEAIRVRAGWALGVLLAACSSVATDAPDSNPGGAGAAGSAAGAAGSAGSLMANAGSPNSGGSSGSAAGSAGAAGITGAQCPGAAPVIVPGATGQVSLPIQVTGAGATLTTGQEVRPEGASPYKLSLLKFFFSQPVLMKADGGRVPAQLLNGAGAPRPYGLLLVDLEDPSSLVVSLAAPRGDYAGLELGIGVPAPCNGGDPTTHVFPLNADSDMYWTWGTGYMFIRVEGSAQADGAWNTFLHHVGFQPAFRITQVTGAIHLDANGATPPTLHLDTDRLLTAPTPTPTPTGGADVWIADNFATRRVLTLVP